MSTHYFAGPEGCIRVLDAAPLLPDAAVLAPRWPQATEPIGGVASGFRAVHEASTWRFEDRGQAMPPMTFDEGLPASLGFVGALLWSAVAQDKAYACLHAGALDAADGLLVLVGDANAGKSTLSVAWAALGRRFVGDDRLVIRLDATPAGIGMALTPKLRLPLPPKAPAEFQAFVAAREVRRYAALTLVQLRPDEVLAFGERRPLQALVLLDRDGFSPPHLEPAPQTDLLDALLEGGFAPRLDAVGRLQAFHRLAALPCLRLTYGDSFAAAALLADIFA
ncbi:MAG TPA: hypothetical protein VMU42_17430 [Candidatus Sulfotelmatobacter sp.]|nr:hypothetical protein [Candidatus Sulfotelmatobacter sp.]